MEWAYRRDKDDVRLDLKKLHKCQPDSSSSSNQDTAPFNKSDGLNTYRLSSEVPVAGSAEGKVNSSEVQQQSHLKKYIQMVLWFIYISLIYFKSVCSCIL